MKINSINQNIFHKFNIDSNKNVAYLNKQPSFDCFVKSNNISFGAKSNLKKLEYIGEENFPNSEILEEYKDAIKNRKNILLRDIHKKVYSQLLDCDTLEEAKEIYPEFKDVIDAKNLPPKKRNRSIEKVAQGKIEGVSLENLSLELLKRHYAQAHTFRKQEIYWGWDAKTNKGIFEILNIKPLNKEYYVTINRETPEYLQMRQDVTTRQWADPKTREARSKDMLKLHQREDFEEKRIASIKKNWQDPQRRAELMEINKKALATRWQDSEAKEKMSAIMTKHWQDPEYREKICSGISKRMYERWQDPNYIEFKTKEKLEQWADPEFREYMSEKMKSNWKNPEYRERMAIYSEALKLAWEMHPEITQRMSEIAKEFPSLKAVLDKTEKGITLSDKEEKIMLAYYKKCHETMPNFTWIVGQTQKEILALWAKENPNKK